MEYFSLSAMTDEKGQWKLCSLRGPKDLKRTYTDAYFSSRSSLIIETGFQANQTISGFQIFFWDCMIEGYLAFDYSTIEIHSVCTKQVCNIN